MKITHLEIKGYKNLKDNNLTKLDLTNSDKYVALIGLNGTGKSNYIEAISTIFLNLKIGKPTDFEYTLKYTIGEYEVTVENDVLTIEAKKIAKKNIIDYLPSNIIASYSGEELRMWENIYQESYSDFFQDLKKSNNQIPFLTYVNKYSWAFALISLLSSENEKNIYFVKDVLKIGDDVEVSFEIDSDRFGLYESNDALLLIKRLDSLQKESDGKLHINTIKTLDIGQRNNQEFTRKLFHYLFIAGMPVKNEKIKVDKIIKKTEIFFDDLDLPKLSEGEKKLILIYFMLNVLADENTLLLLDEPDAHIHIERKQDIIDMVSEANCFTIFTTHSPKILKCVSDENIRILRNTENGLEVINLDKFNAISEITNGEFSIIDASIALSSTKPLLLVEGKGDAAYISTAVHLLSNKTELDIDILPFGGAGNAKGFIDELAKCLPNNKTIIVLFDRDEAGAGSEKGGMKSCVNFKSGRANEKTYIKDNFIFLMLPKTNDHKGADFLIEDYFSVEKKNEIAKRCIENAEGAFNSFPKDLRQSIKDELGKNLDQYTIEEFTGFQVLIDKLKKIIGKVEPLENEENLVENQPKKVAKKKKKPIEQVATIDSNTES